MVSPTVTAPQSTPELSREQIEQVQDCAAGMLKTGLPYSIRPATIYDICDLALRTLKAEAESFEWTHKLVCGINEDRYGKPLVAALHLCVDLEEEKNTLTAELSRKQEVLKELIEHEQYAAIQYRHSTSSNSALYDSKKRWLAARAEIEEGK